jgi:hypothetical protein
MASDRCKYSFVARIWLEPVNNGDTTWRGHIRHVQSEEEKYFQNLMEMREFLGRVSGVKGPPLTPQRLTAATESTPDIVTRRELKPL